MYIVKREQLFLRFSLWTLQNVLGGLSVSRACAAILWNRRLFVGVNNQQPYDVKSTLLWSYYYTDLNCKNVLT